MNINDVWTADTTYTGKPLDNEAEVIEAAKAGDSEAYYTLAVQYGNVLRSSVSRYADYDGQDIEDARASVLAALWAAITTWEGGSFAALLPRFTKADATHKNSAADFLGSESGISPQSERLYRRAIRATESLDDARDYAGDVDRYNRLAPATFDVIHAHLGILNERADVAELADMAEPVDAFTRWEKLTDTRNAVDALEPKYRAVIRRAYGFDGTGSEDVNVRAQVFPAVHSDGEVSKYVEVSRATVQRYREAGLGSLKVSLAVYGPESREV